MLVEKGFSINEKTFVENFHLLTKDGNYNKMAELLADKNEISIKVVRFNGGVTIDNWIEEQIRKNPKITTEELAKLSGKSVITIKRHITKLSHIKYVGSGYSGHWEIVKR